MSECWLLPAVVNTHEFQPIAKMKNIGVTLKSLRVEKGYTLRQVAEKAQMPYPHLSNIENGKRIPGLDLIDRICFALGVPLKHVILKSELEREFKEDRKILLRDLQPYFRKIDAIAKQIYDSGSGGNDDDDTGSSQETTTPIIQGGGAQEVQSK